MQKRTNPLELNNDEKQMKKRTSPLTVEKPVKEQERLDIKNMPNFKKRFVFTRASKELITLLKKEYPNYKLGEILEYVMLTHLEEINQGVLDDVIGVKVEGDSE